MTYKKNFMTKAVGSFGKLGMKSAARANPGKKKIGSYKKGMDALGWAHMKGKE